MATRIALNGLLSQVTSRSELVIYGYEKSFEFNAQLYTVAGNALNSSKLLTVMFKYYQLFPTTRHDDIEVSFEIIGENGEINNDHLKSITLNWRDTTNYWVTEMRHVACSRMVDSTDHNLLSPSDPILQPFYERFHETLRAGKFHGIIRKTAHARFGSVIEKFRWQMIKSLQAASGGASHIPIG
jgi:hypothetical protein